MKNHLIIASLLLFMISCKDQKDPVIASDSQEPLENLRFGQIKPKGWILSQMKGDLQDGFVGHLNQLVPDLITEDDIYGRDRLTKLDSSKNVGVEGASNANWEVQFLWWNSETQSNWWDGYIRNAILTDDREAMEKVVAYVENKLSTQDPNGYIGIYAEDLRYDHSTENGELWAQSSLFRGLLAYYEATGEQKVLDAVEKAVRLTMEAYPAGNSTPFNIEKAYAGVGHGLTFTDVLDQLYQITGNREYLDYANFLFEDYNKYPFLPEGDVQVENLMNEEYRFKGHGVHTYEHLRTLALVAHLENEPSMVDALEKFIEKLDLTLTPSGGPIGDEFIFGRTANADSTGYEYCSLHELLDSYGNLLQKSGDPAWADRMEWLIYNAGQGARHPNESSIAYCKTDNSYHMLGNLFPVEGETHGKRFKYSPSHQDAAVCCVPNAGRIYPYFVKSMWMRNSKGWIVNLYGPSELSAELEGNRITITQVSDYPFEHKSKFRINVDAPVEFEISLRIPGWAKDHSIISTGEQAVIAKGNKISTIKKTWTDGNEFEIEFYTEPRLENDLLGNSYAAYGPLVYALPLKAEETVIREFDNPGFRDLYYESEDTILIGNRYSDPYDLRIESLEYDKIDPWSSPTTLKMSLIDNGAPKDLDMPVYFEGTLLPMGSTLLRKVTFENRNKNSQ